MDSIKKIELAVVELKTTVEHIDQALRGNLSDTSKKSLIQRVCGVETHIKIINSILYPLLIGIIITGIKLWLV